MLTPSQHSLAHRAALLMVRLTLGVNLFFAGKNKAFMAGKSIAESASAWMEGYQKSVPPWLPAFIATPYGYAIPWLEIILGILLALGIFFRTTATATTLLLLSIAAAVVTAKGLSGGDKMAIHISLLLASVTFLLIFTGPGGFSLDALLPKRRKNRA